MTDMEKRIEAAAKEWHRRFLSHTGTWETVGQLERDRIHKAMRGVLSASFPEFFTDPPSMWLAPVEPDKRVIAAGENELEEQTESDYDSDAEGNRSPYTYYRSGHVRAVYLAMMRAHLSSALEEGGGE